jgi:hypothetical protein
MPRTGCHLRVLVSDLARVNPYDLIMTGQLSATRAEVTRGPIGQHTGERPRQRVASAKSRGTYAKVNGRNWLWNSVKGRWQVSNVSGVSNVDVGARSAKCQHDMKLIARLYPAPSVAGHGLWARGEVTWFIVQANADA